MERHLAELLAEIKNAKTKLGITDKEEYIKELEKAAQAPDFWVNQDEATAKSKELARLRTSVDTWNSLEQRAQDLTELVKLDDKSLEAEIVTQLDELQKDYSEQELVLMFSGPYDSHAVLIEIHAGTGGVDAMDWAQILERMYLRYGESSGMKTQVIDEATAEEAGIKRALLRLEGDYAYGKLKSEHGVHRLVRLSPFNADSLRQTSFALVHVLPEINTPSEVDIDEKDLRIDVFRAGGHGGQSVNTTDSAVRITHLPTGIVVSIQNERSQLQNKQTALNILRSRLAQLAMEQHKEKISEIKGPDTKAEWGRQIRNYVMHPYTLVKDTRTNYETSDIESVLNGKIDYFISAYLKSELSDSAK